MNILFLKEKRDECITKLNKSTVRLYLQGFLSIYERVKTANRKPRELLKEFQHAIREISSWSIDQIREEHKQFKGSCDMFDGLVKSIFKLHLSIYNTMHESDFDSVIFPTPGEYMHETYLAVARRLWKDPSLVYDVKVDKITCQKNIMRLEKIICRCMNETFICMLPFKEFDEIIAKQEQKNEQEEDDDETVDGMVEDVEDEHEHEVSEHEVSEHEVSEHEVDEHEVDEHEVGEHEVDEHEVGERDLSLEDEHEISEHELDDELGLEDEHETDLEHEDELEAVKKNGGDDETWKTFEHEVEESIEMIKEETEDLCDEGNESEEYVNVKLVNHDIRRLSEPELKEHTIRALSEPVENEYEEDKLADQHLEIRLDKHDHRKPEIKHNTETKIINILPQRRTLADRKKLVKERVKQHGFPDFAAPKDAFF